ncbi:MAG: SNF2-related protein [Slackia sp.]|nr:SNF2-related protein [Slackia sp.]
MISDYALARACPPKTLHRGKQIASSSDNFLMKQCRFDHHSTHISALVASSHGWDDRYRTAVSLDEEADRILDYSCTCPAYIRYDGPCKHCVAAICLYNEHPEQFSGYRAARDPETSPSLAALMKHADARRSAATCGERVDVEPTLHYAYGTWSVRFRLIGQHGAYIMKDIASFVDDCRSCAYRSYGKKLAFAHAPEAFTPRGRALAAFLDRTLAAREGLRAGTWAFPARREAHRELELDLRELVDLLDAAGDAPFAIEGHDASVPAKTIVHIEKSDPRIAVDIDFDPRGGCLLRCRKRAVVVSHADRMYLWQGETLHRCSPDLAVCGPFLSALFDAYDTRLFVSENDLALFCATVLVDAERHLEVSAPEKLDEWRPVPVEIAFYFDRIRSFIVCEAVARYGAAQRILTPSGAIWRDEKTPRPFVEKQREQEALALLASFFDDGARAEIAQEPERHVLSLKDDTRCAELLFGGLARFAEQGAVFTTDAFDRLVSDRKPRIALGVSLQGGLIELDVDADDLGRDELSALLASYRCRKRYHRLKNGSFLDIAELDLAQLDRIASDLDIAPRRFDEGIVKLPAYRACYVDEVLDGARKDDAFVSYAQRLRTRRSDRIDVPATLRTTLRPYQEEGFRWMNALADMRLGGILADEMGLGKSVQLIAFLLAHLDETRAGGRASIIVCPASLVYNWHAEITRFAPGLHVRVVAGTARERRAARADSTADIIVTSYDLARIDMDDYAKRSFFCCALDEAHYIKNQETLTARAMKRIDADVRFALTGTPIENKLSEMWSIFDFLMPGFLGSYMRFRERFESDIVGGNEEAATRLRALIGPFMMRRLKSDVLDDLPEKTESTIYVRMPLEQRRIYKAYEQNLRETLLEQKRRGKDERGSRSNIEVLAEITRLRRLCCDPRLVLEDYPEHGPKARAIADLVAQAHANSRKTLVFSQFTSFLDLIADELDACGIAHYAITGSTPKRHRTALAASFNDDDTPAFLISLKAGGTGLNLTGASVVIHADPWWNCAAMDQASGRAHRIGQRRTVNVYRIILEDTVEERILSLQEAKSALSDKIIENVSAPFPRLTGDELLALLEV